jgi:hypothetical protein
MIDRPLLEPDAESREQADWENALQCGGSCCMGGVLVVGLWLLVATISGLRAIGAVPEAFMGTVMLLGIAVCLVAIALVFLLTVGVRQLRRWLSSPR